jgi:hypothetical protein
MEGAKEDMAGEKILSIDEDERWQAPVEPSLNPVLTSL